MHIVTFEEQNEGNGPVGLVYLNVDFLPFEGFCDLQRFRLIGIMMDSRNGELSCLNDIFLMGDRVLGSERLRLSPSSFKASSPVKDQYEPAPCFFFFSFALECPIQGRHAICETRGLFSSESQCYFPISSIRPF